MMLSEKEFVEFLQVADDAPPMVRRIAGGDATVADARDVLYLMLAFNYAMQMLPGYARGIETFARALNILEREERLATGGRDADGT